MGDNLNDLAIMPWLQEQYSSISKLYFKNKLPKVLLLYGSPWIGKTEMALAIVKLMLCSDKRHSDCNCSNCSHLKNNILPPDLTILGAPREAQNNIKVDDVRALIETASKTSFRSENVGVNNKVFVILNAENLNNAAANALLKILEAEDISNYFIITSSLYYKLLPTIVSRCYKVNLSISNAGNLVYNWLSANGVDNKQQMDILLELSAYAPKKALAYYNNQYMKKLDELNVALLSLNKSNIGQQVTKIINIFTESVKLSTSWSFSGFQESTTELQEQQDNGHASSIESYLINKTKKPLGKKLGSKFNYVSFFDLISFALVKLIDRKVNFVHANKLITIINNYKKTIDNGVTIDHSNMIFSILYKLQLYSIN